MTHFNAKSSYSVPRVGVGDETDISEVVSTEGGGGELRADQSHPINVLEDHEHLSVDNYDGREPTTHPVLLGHDPDEARGHQHGERHPAVVRYTPNLI